MYLLMALFNCLRIPEIRVKIIHADPIHSVPPNSGPHATAYTVPTVQLPDGTYLMDSRPIATKLEELYPTPSLHLESPLPDEVQKMVWDINGPLKGIWMPKLSSRLLNERSVEVGDS